MSAPEFLTQTLGTTYQISMPNQTHASENTKPHVQILSGLLGKPRGPSPPVPAELASPCRSPPLQIKINKKKLQSRSAVKVDVKVTVKTAQSL